MDMEIVKFANLIFVVFTSLDDSAFSNICLCPTMMRYITKVACDVAPWILVD